MILMKSQILAITALSAVLGAGQPAIGQVIQCARMQADLAQLEDGSLFYRPHVRRGAIEWKRLPAGQALDTTQPVKMDFIYVAREYWLQDRPGMVIIKSGRTLGSDQSPSGPEMVGLRRIETAQANPNCGKTYSYKGKVLGESYDRFHDAGYRIPLNDQAILENGLHSDYAGRGGGCKSSSSTTGDTLFGRSNRGQFSFSDSVVAGRLKDQVFAAIGMLPAHAGNGYSDRAVEVRRYRTNENRIACVAFTLTVSQPNFFLKINDLERVKGSEQFPEEATNRSGA
jgi:hypothetical protein